MKAKLYFILSMVIFGTIGIFVRFINLESSEIAMLRGLVGCLFLVLISMLRRERMSPAKIRENWRPLVISGYALAGNWIFLFEAYKHATIANVTLMLTNKFIKGMNSMETTLLQLAITTLLLLVDVQITGGMDWSGITAMAVVSVMALGLVRIGLGFYLFFTGMKGLNGQSVVTLSYIDPITALLASYLIFGEVMNAALMLGAVLLLGATFLGEYKTVKNQELVGNKRI